MAQQPLMTVATRLTQEEYAQIRKMTYENGHGSISSFIAKFLREKLLKNTGGKK